HELSARLAKVATAIFRNKTILFDYYTMERDEVGSRRVDPYHLLFQGGQFYLLGYAHEREAIRVFRLSRIRGKVSYATKAEHDFHRPADFDPRAYADRADRQLGDQRGTAAILLPERIARQVERQSRRSRRARSPAAKSPGAAGGVAAASRARGGRRAGSANGDGEGARSDAAIRPERFARLVTLASILIQAGRAGERVAIAEVCERLQISEEELREDINVLNVVNFGGGSYVLYAEIKEEEGEIEVDPEPY